MSEPHLLPQETSQPHLEQPGVHLELCAVFSAELFKILNHVPLLVHQSDDIVDCVDDAASLPFHFGIVRQVRRFYLGEFGEQLLGIREIFQEAGSETKDM